MSVETVYRIIVILLSYLNMQNYSQENFGYSQFI